MKSIGTIVKGIGGFYYVKCGNDTLECKVRGRFRNEKITPLVGDHVEIEYFEDKKGVIIDILTRKNCMIRPPVANIDQVILVISPTHPEPNLVLVDKFLIMLERKDINTILCINKSDLDTDDDCIKIAEIYKNVGCDVICTSAKHNIGIDELKIRLKNKISTFAGNSGVGKSTLLNIIHNDLIAATGELSAKIERGKHTTRHVELFEIQDGFLLDTPGFNILEMDQIPKSELKFYYKEFDRFNNCKFAGCTHIHEPFCGVIEAVKNNKIDNGRYERYKLIYNELSKKYKI